MTSHLRVIEGGGAGRYYQVSELGDDDGNGFVIVFDLKETIELSVAGGPLAKRVRRVATPPVYDRAVAEAFCNALNDRHEHEDALFGNGPEPKGAA